MKAILTILLILTISVSNSQIIGDSLSVILLDNKIDHYVTNDYYYEIIIEGEPATTIFSLYYFNDVIFGVDYVYNDKTNLKQALDSILDSSVRIGYNTFIKANGDIVTIHNDELIMIRNASIIQSRGIFGFNEE